MRRRVYTIIKKVFNFDRTVTLISTKHRLLFLLAVFSLSAYPQRWSTFLDSSRAIDWTSAGFTIPNYLTNCATQPTLTANNPSAAAANGTSIQNALASCDAAHNVVNIAAGNYYVAAWGYGSQGHQVVRGAGPNSTYIYLTTTAGCDTWSEGICMAPPTGITFGNPEVHPPSGSKQCAWTSGYAQGTTTITLSSCGGAPPNNTILILDQANDLSDTGGVYICDTSSNSTCTNKGLNGGNNDGRIIGGVSYSQSQSVRTTAVTDNGNGTYSVTISPGVYFTNIRSGQSPGAWWPGFIQNDGLENLTIDHSQNGDSNIAMINCYQCWIRNVRSLYGGRNHVLSMETLQSVIRDSYFYEAQTFGSDSYGVEIESASSNLLIENNIFQQTTAPLMFGQGSGCVVGYNYSIDDVYTSAPTWAQLSYYGHNAGDEMNLWEGNNLFAINADSTTWGSSTQGTFFRNMLIGWQSGKLYSTYPVSIESWSRAFNVVGNVLGQPGYDDTYEAYATSTTGGVNAAKVNTSIYALGWTGIGGSGTCDGPPVCGPLVRSTLMRWGNWDVVTNGTRWDSTEASPAAVPYINANFTSSYFSSLAHTLPASLYYTSRPSWWPAGKAWPTVGPDVSTGNLGTCSGGTYAGVQTTAAIGGCTGGSFGGVQYASHATTIPAQDCYLSTMHGPPDGSGGVLPFDASLCYASSQTSPAPPTPPKNLVTTAR